MLNFTKMHGCGNDYIYFDCFYQDVYDPETLAIILSDRHFGIGGDGIVLICPSEVADARMRMFNLDGSEGRMCGNAIRCVGKYLYEHDHVNKTSITVETFSGIKTLELNVEDGKVTSVKVDMGKAILDPKKIPCKLGGDKIINVETDIAGGKYKINAVSMGNPHCVLFTDSWKGFDLNRFNISEIGPKFENDPLFPTRVNTEFCKIIDDHTMSMRVWERGSGETRACGTGACASVVAAVENGYFLKGKDINVRLLGGELTVNYTDEGVFMTGPAVEVFSGTVNM